MGYIFGTKLWEKEWKKLQCDEEMNRRERGTHVDREGKNGWERSGSDRGAEEEEKVIYRERKRGHK